MIVTNIVSLDGYNHGPGRSVVALALDGTCEADCAGRLRTADTLLLGGTPVVLFAGSWPPVADDAGLVDESHLVIAGLALGGGTPAFSEGFSASLQRLGTRTFEDSEKVVISSAPPAA